MSRIGKKEILIPDGVTVEIINGTVDVKGPKGELTYQHHPDISVKVEDGFIKTEIVKQSKKAAAYWGLVRSLVANMVIGVTEGFKKELELVGVGYRAKESGKDGISITVGYSHPVEFEAPEGITFEVEDQKKVTVSGIDKQLVGHVAASIRKVRKPEPYKGKGIKYVGEIINRKPGKAGKV